MKPKNLSVIGQTTDAGGMMISNRVEMESFFKQHPGQRFIMAVTMYPPKGSKALRGFYFGKVVPDFRQIIREVEGEYLSLKETDLKLRKMCPATHEEIPSEEAGGFDLVRVKTAYELSGVELLELVEHCLNVAGRDYGHPIETLRR